MPRRADVAYHRCKQTVHSMHLARVCFMCFMYFSLKAKDAAEALVTTAAAAERLCSITCLCGHHNNSTEPMVLRQHAAPGKGASYSRRPTCSPRRRSLPRPPTQHEGRTGRAAHALMHTAPPQGAQPAIKLCRELGRLPKVVGIWRVHTLAATSLAGPAWVQVMCDRFGQCFGTAHPRWQTCHGMAQRRSR